MQFVGAQQYSNFSRTYGLGMGESNLFSRGIQCYNDSVAYIQFYDGQQNSFEMDLCVASIDLRTSDTNWTIKINNYHGKYHNGQNNSMVILDNYIYIAGSYSYSNISQVPFLIKLKLNGDLVWRKLFYNFSHSYSMFNALKITKDRKLIAIGSEYTSFSPNQCQIIATKLDTNGVRLFTKLIGSSYWEEGHSVDTTSDGGFILSGFRRIYIPADTASINQGLVVKIDSVGNFIWENLLNNKYKIRVKSLTDNSILAFGEIDNDTTYPLSKGYCAKIDQNGVIFKERKFEFSSTFTNEFVDVCEFQNHLYFVGKAMNDITLITAGFFFKSTMDLDSVRFKWTNEASNTNGLFNIIRTENNHFLMQGYAKNNELNFELDSWLRYTNCIGSVDSPEAISKLNFTSVNFTDSVKLTNQSTDYDYCMINWGDGKLDSVFFEHDSILTHKYALPGQYNITLLAIACEDTSFWQTTLTILPLGFTNRLTISPNPTNGNLSIWCNSQSAFQLQMYDASGRLVMQENINENTVNHGYQININSLSSGIYLLNLVSETENLQVKVMKSE